MQDDAILQERERSRTPAFMGPTLYTVGPRIEGYGDNTPDEVERIVRENVERGFDVVKVHGRSTISTSTRLGKRR